MFIHQPIRLGRPFEDTGDLPFGTISVNFDLKRLIERSEVPS